MRHTERPREPVVLGAIPTNVLLTGGLEGRAMLNASMGVGAVVAVTTATKRSHDLDAALWHKHRPSLTRCPYDDACRFA